VKVCGVKLSGVVAVEILIKYCCPIVSGIGMTPNVLNEAPVTQASELSEPQLPESSLIVVPAAARLTPTLPKVMTGYAEFALNLYQTSDAPAAAQSLGTPAVPVAFNSVPDVVVHVVEEPMDCALEHRSFPGGPGFVIQILNAPVVPVDEYTRT